MHSIRFVPLSKYDTVIEKSDGTVIINPHRKLHYVFCAQNHNGIFIFNNLHFFVAKYDIEKETLQYLPGFDESFIKSQNTFGSHPELLAFYSKNKACISLADYEGNILQTLHCPSSIAIDCFYFIDDLHIWCVEKENRKAQLISLQNDNCNIIKSFSIKGIGDASILHQNEFLYISDSEENIVRCYNTENGQVVYEAITPFIDPIGQLFWQNKHYILYSGLENEVGYENRCWQEQRPFFHQLKVSITENEHYIQTHTNSFLLDFYYEENFIEPIDFFPFRIKLKLPENTLHQKVLFIEPIGISFNCTNDGFAEFIINREMSNTKRFGFKARIQTSSVKLTPKKTLNLKQPSILSQDDIEHLNANDSYFDFFNLHKSRLTIDDLINLRNIIFERLYYKKNTCAIDFIEVWKDGYGTCGDYTSLILIACHKNSIAINSATGYKVPRFYFRTLHPYSIYYNHSWLEAYDEYGNILPFESSSDDKEIEGIYCEGQFLGLDWSHIKLYNNKAFKNFIYFPDYPDKHPFDYLGHPMAYVKIIDEID